MANILVTGATGLVGHNIARVLREQGHAVRVLARDPERAQAIVPEGCQIVRGDVTELPSLRAACEGIDTVYTRRGFQNNGLPEMKTFNGVNVAAHKKC